MKEMNVGVLGATGAVGQEMLKILAERDFPVRSVRPLASARSAGKTILFKGETVPIVEAKEDAFRGLDLVLGAAENDIAKRFAPHILDAGAVFVDNSSAFRLREDVPLIVPEINPEDAKWHKGIIANPNCTTIVTLVAVAPLAKASPIETMIASSYQAVSGAGVAGMRELTDEIEAGLKGEPYAPKAFAHQIAYNVIPQIGSEQYLGYTSEEMKMQNEGRKILHLPDMKVSCTCVTACPWCCGPRRRYPWTGLVRLSPPPPAASWWTIFPITCTPCPSIPRTRISSSWGASGRISPPTTDSTSGAAATRSAKAPPPTRCKSRNCCSKLPRHKGPPILAVLFMLPRIQSFGCWALTRRIT